jgi:site-specific recombinase XerD
MTAATVAASAPAPDPRWADIAARAPRLAATMHAYLDQMALSLRPGSVDAVELALRGFAGFLTTEHRVRALRSVQHRHIEGHKAWLAAQSAGPNKTLSPRTLRHRLGMLRVVFAPIIDWGWDDAPKRCPILQTDLPRDDDPLPKILDDAAAALMRATATATPLDRLVVELLARTGLRAGELCALETNAVVRIGATEWLRVPVGKLRIPCRSCRFMACRSVGDEQRSRWC